MALVYDTKGNQAGSSTININLTLDATVKLLVVAIVSSVTTQRTGGAPTWNTTETLTQIGSSVTGSKECNTEMFYLLNPTSGAHTVSVPNTNSLVLNVIASAYKGATAGELDQSTSDGGADHANPSCTLNNVPTDSVVVDVLGSGYKDVIGGNTGGTLLYAIDGTAWNDAGQYADKKLIDSYTSDLSTYGAIGQAADPTERGQSFTAIAGTLKQVSFYLARLASTTGNVYAKLYAHSGTYGTSSVGTGDALAVSDAVDASSIPTSSPPTEPTTFIFSGVNQYALSASTYYVITAAFVGDATHYLYIYGNSPGTHSGNACSYQSPTWDYGPYDWDFSVYGKVSGSMTLSYTQSSDDVAMIMASFKETPPTANAIFFGINF